MERSSQHLVAGTLQPGKSLARLFETLRDLEWHSVADLHEVAGGVNLEQRLHTLKKLGSFPRRGQTHTWALEFDETGQRVRFRHLVLK